VHRVFVYGSLRRGQPAHALLGACRFLGPARTASHWSLFDLGTYPGASRGGERPLEGEVYEVGEATLAELDAYEGCPDLFVREQVGLEGGGAAWIYALAAGAPEGEG
jgi:gamma-glutamylaminecyclotransferase